MTALPGSLNDTPPKCNKYVAYGCEKFKDCCDRTHCRYDLASILECISKDCTYGSGTRNRERAKNALKLLANYPPVKTSEISSLLPCPFCGSKKAMPLSADRDSQDRVFPIVRCMGCYTDVPGDNNDFSSDAKSAIKTWNTRATEPVSGEHKEYCSFRGMPADECHVCKPAEQPVGSSLMRELEARKKAAPGPELYVDGWECAIQCAINIVREHERESGWRNIKTSPPKDGEECFIWLKPVNGNGEAHWSIRRGRFWNGAFSEWGEMGNYKSDTYSRITHWCPYPDAPPTNEIEGRSNG